MFKQKIDQYHNHYSKSSSCEYEHQIRFGQKDGLLV